MRDTEKNPEGFAAIDTALRLSARRGWNQSEFAERVGATPADVSNWKSRGMASDRFVAVAQALSITVEELVGRFVPDGVATDGAGTNIGEYVAAASLRRVPVVGTAKMGPDGYYDEISAIAGAGDGFVEISTRDPGAYALRLRGMSMFPAIRDGWYVVISPSATPCEGEYVLLRLRDGRKMVKELLFRRNGAIEVMSVNGGERFRVELSELDDLQAVAAVVSPSHWRPE